MLASVLGSIRPRQIFYHRRSDRMLIIEFRKENNELSDDSYSRLKWMAPEIYQKNSKSVSANLFE